MLLTLTTTHRPATDLGYLLAKNPAHAQRFSLTFGEAHVFYPEATEQRCTAALWVEVDPVGLTRAGKKKKKDAAGLLPHYVHDRAYAPSSLFSVALNRVFRSAMAGESKERPELAAQAIPLRAELSAVPARGGEAFVRSLFEPLGWTVTTEAVPLDPELALGREASRYLNLTLEGEARLADLLTHLYVLIPVLDDDKHYWVGEAEVDKLLAKGAAWLPSHPHKDEIARRYLARQRSLVRQAVARLSADDGTSPDEADRAAQAEEDALERPASLNQTRLEAVVEVLREVGARRVLDLGCGEGRLLSLLLAEPTIERAAGMDVSARALERAARRLRLDRMPEAKRARVELLQGSLTYRDLRLLGHDAFTLVEVVEHVDAERLPALARVVFELAAPSTVIVTTPNVEHNVRYEGLPAGRLRHRDHRFEWTRAEFRAWCEEITARTDYRVELRPVGADDPEVGPPTQMAVFRR